MKRIVITISVLNKKNWIILYEFIKSIFNNISLESKSNALSELKRIADVIVKSEDGSEDIYYKLQQLNSENSSISLIYKKKDNNEDVTELVPFILLQHEFNGKLSLGIDVEALELKKQHNYCFKCSDLFLLFDGHIPNEGREKKRNIYFLNQTFLNTETGALEYFAPSRITSLAGQGLEGGYKGTNSRRYLPIIQITEDNYKSIFGINVDRNSKELEFIKGSLDKIKKDILKGKKYQPDVKSELKSIFDLSETYFGQWLEAGYFLSYEKLELQKMKVREIKGIRQTLQIYKNTIFELIQNIIFHGGALGFFYCVFNKKSNLPADILRLLPNIETYNDSDRFLQIGVFDYNKIGIVDTYRKYDDSDDDIDLSLRDFFDPNSIAITGLSRLDMRYAARLGVKSFVKTVLNHKGYFSVGSNETNQGKKYITTTWQEEGVVLTEKENVDFTDGTHYEIILPVPSFERQSERTLPVQQISILSENNKHSYRKINQIIPVFSVDPIKICGIKDSISKKEQIHNIKKICEEIINKNSTRNNNEIALDLKGYDLDPKLVFKIAAFLQLTSKNDGYEIIIFINCNNNFINGFCDLLKSTLIEPNDINMRDDCPIWSKDCASILISEDLNVQIIWGKTKNDIQLINLEMQKYYGNNFFITQKRNSFIDVDEEYNITQIDNKAKRYILRYDMLIDTGNNITPFELFVRRVLRRKIGLKGLGFLVNHENTYIGNKIIVKNYYEADMMFQNSFFTERFAILVARSIRKELLNDNKKLVLIGYKNYSEFLLKSIKHYFNDKSIYSIIANEENDDLNTDALFKFDIDGDGKSLQEQILLHPNDFNFVTIVPIGATLSTNDKIIAFFRLWFKKEQEKKGQIYKEQDLSFIHNHCVILVRDKNEETPTIREKEQKWLNIDTISREVTTVYQNAKSIHYTIQIASETDSSEPNWRRRLNNEVSFPGDWQEEKYVNFTENSSINSQNLMGLPLVYTEGVDHEKELKRLFSLMNYIYKGHFEVFGFHHKYYIDTESFVRNGGQLFNEWLDKRTEPWNRHIFNQEKLNVLITPNAESESDFVCAVNDRIFEGNALIIYLDINNWRNNIVQKLSFLNDLSPNKVRYHYVDQAMLTGDTYRKTKSYFFSIFQGRSHVKFESIICVVNRLTYAKNREIMNDVKYVDDKNGQDCSCVYNLIAYVNLHYPTSMDGEQDCELCKLEKYYNRLKKLTVLESCQDIINKNQDKIQLRTKSEIEPKERKSNQNKMRNFLRLVMTHELYYVITKIITELGNSCDFSTTCERVIDELDSIYHQLNCEENLSAPNSISTINQHIIEWFEGKTGIEDYDRWEKRKMVIDKKISFIKVISSPPLSRYIILRDYAQNNLLTELFKIINKNEKEYSFDDLRLVKSILKSLSFLKSNALVRKNVIIGIWNVLRNVLNNLNNEIVSLDKIFDIVQIEKKKIEDIKTQRSLFDTDKEKLDEISLVLREEKSSLSQTAERIVKDFSRDVQFFIKNAIIDDETKATFLGNLIRSGDEIDINTETADYRALEICETRLSLNNSLVNQQNHLFNVFRQDNTSNSGILKKEYANFLVWLFYDNTTITRKTLDNFQKELYKDKSLDSYFRINNMMQEFNVFKEKEAEIENKFEKIILGDSFQEGGEYYYSSFKPYLKNKDNIKFVRKLIYVTYAKLKLEEIIDKNLKTGIESDSRILLKIFVKIMGADAAFLTMKRGDGFCPVSLVGINGDEWDHDRWNFDDYYTREIFGLRDLNSPFYPKYEIRKNMQNSPYYGESRDLYMRSLGIYVITDSEEKTEEKTVEATITFLYNKDNPIIANEAVFRINIQESGRLLLLLKNEIDQYVIGHLKKDKVFDLWEEKHKSSRKFEKIYASSAHIFKSVYDEMEEFEELDEDSIIKMSKTWFFLANETISFIYSNIEKNFSKNHLSLSPDFLQLQESVVIDRQNVLGKTFNDKYVAVLSALLGNRWNTDKRKRKDYNRNKIFINGQSVENFKLARNLRKVTIPVNKHLLRTIIAQCLHNSLSPISRHGHRHHRDVKEVHITITYNNNTSVTSIVIKDKSIGRPNINVKKYREAKAEQFKKKKKYINQMRCDNYSSTTLTSLRGIEIYLKKRRVPFHCNYWFDTDYNFVLSIEYYNINNKK